MPGSSGPATGHQLLVCARYVRDGEKLARLVISFRGATSQERADREQANLVATVAHEIRSPLTGVKGFTATLLAKWDRLDPGAAPDRPRPGRLRRVLDLLRGRDRAPVPSTAAAAG